ncbi:MAG: cupin domain-containing protein [Asticcacaulis sp.]
MSPPKSPPKSMPRVIRASDAPGRQKPSVYPDEFALRMAGRSKRPLGDLFGLGRFGVNLTELAPGAVSALHHVHSLQDEFIYVLEGECVLIAGDEVVHMQAGDCAGFAAGREGHHLENRSQARVVYLEVGDRTAGDEVQYPNDDLKATHVAGGWVFTRKNGTSFDKGET